MGWLARREPELQAAVVPPGDRDLEVGEAGIDEDVRDPSSTGTAPRACAGLVNAVNWKRGRAGPDLALVAARPVDGGRTYGRRIDIRADAGCASRGAEKLLPAGVRSSLVSATEALARARPRQEQR